MDRVILLDTYNFIHRSSIFATKGLGDYIIVFNFFRNLRSLIEELKPNKIFACLEGSNNFRYKLFEGYKANRIIKEGAAKTKEENEDFRRQKDIILDLLQYLPIDQVKADGFECDDVINTLAADLKDEEIIIVSNDQDLQQILQKGYKNAKIYNPFKKQFIEPPSYFVLTFKALFGDKSDNIPGIIGKKKAIELTEDPEKLKTFLAESDERKIAFSDNIELIRLRSIPFDDLQFIEGKTNWTYLKIKFEEFEFKTIVRYEYWQKFKKTFEEVKL